MSSLFTLGDLGTLAGATTATALLVQVAKGLPLIRRASPRLLAVGFALVILTLADIATDTLDWGQAPLLVLNTLLVAASAIGTWHVVSSA